MQQLFYFQAIQGLLYFSDSQNTLIFNGKERALYFFVKLRHPCFSGFAPSIIVLMGLPHLEFRCSPNFNNDLYKWLSQWYWCKQELHNKHPFQSPACNVGTLAHSKEDAFLFICLWFFVWMQLIHCIFPDPVEESQKNKEKNFQPLANQRIVCIDGWVYPWRCREMYRWETWAAMWSWLWRRSQVQTLPLIHLPAAPQGPDSLIIICVKYLRRCCLIACGTEKILLTSVSPLKSLFSAARKGFTLWPSPSPFDHCGKICGKDLPTPPSSFSVFLTF